MTDSLPELDIASLPYQAALEQLWDLAPAHIALKLRDDPAFTGLDVRRLAEQVAQRRAVAAKVPTWGAQAGLIWPPSLAVEQASSEATARYKRRLLGSPPADTVLVDFSAGMGVDAWAVGSLLSQPRRRARALLYEQQPQLAAITQHNLTRLLPDLALDVRAQAAPVGAASELPVTPQIWLFDPARRSESGGRLRDFADCTPNVLKHLAKVPEAVQRVLVKAAPMLDQNLAIAQLEAAGTLRVTAVHVVARVGVCREVLYLLERPQAGWQTADRRFHAVNLEATRTELWSQRQEEGLEPAPCGPVEEYLFDPHAALRKLKLLGPLCRQFGLRQVAPQTLLLTGPRVIADFPGRAFRVIDGPLKKPARAPADRAASIVTRNFPESAATLRRRWKLAESERQFLLAFRDREQRPVVWYAERVRAPQPGA